METPKGFRFKQFTIHDDQCEMKVGTDGVLLGAWVNIANARFILDIGTGSGLIALMLAQRTPPGTFIDAVEPAARDVEQARSNVSSSPWHDRVRIHQCAIQDFQPSRSYDLIVSNPPYFSSSLLPPSGQRAQARHTVGLTHYELLNSVSRLLASDGRLAVVLPASEGDRFRHLAGNAGLSVMRSLAFYTRPGKKQERWLFEMCRSGREIQPEVLTLYGGKGSEWSAAYRNLTGDFYLDGTPDR
jgi:tRNA1Val (adenine37-N6)-methyltransferase